jgi:CRISPR/Cas system-associated exonuclease Cas4 (RecB family)
MAMSLFFPHEIATHVFVDEGYIVIEQYVDNNLVDQISSVRLTEHQFMEIFNREKQIRKMLEDEGSAGVMP